MTIGSTNTLSQGLKPYKNYTEAQVRTKFEKLTSSMDRVTELKELGYYPKTIDEARRTVRIAEEEFGKTSSVAIKPLFTLSELLGKYKFYEEADRSFEKIYMITESGDDASTVSAIAYRVRIARLYVAWNKFKKAELTLLKAQEIVESTVNTSRSKFSSANWKQDQVKLPDPIYAVFTKQINAELEKIYALLEVNRYNN